MRQPRQLAVEICLQVLVRGVSLSEALEKQLNQLESERDRSFCSELCYGFCRYFYVLQASIKSLMKKPLKPRDQDVLVILLLGLYQIRFMRVEDHAAVNESVKLLKKNGKDWAKGLVNGVLRSYIRELHRDAEGSENIVANLTDKDHANAYPDWIRQKINQDWPEHSMQVLAAGNKQAPMVMRVDVNRISRENMLAKLTEQSISATYHPVISSAIILERAQSVENLPGFSEGLLSVQDASAQIAATLLDCQPGMKVLDACAAPGGKTLHILQVVEDLELTALDKDENRLQRVHENLNRAGVKARVVCADAAEVDSWFDGAEFDRILLDAPCSASGIIRRHPDIRLLRKASDISSLIKQQQRLLDCLWPLVKPGGLLIYSTCSIFKAENEQQVERFVSTQDNCAELPLNTVQWGQQRPFGRQILPGHDDEMDGFYYSCLAKQPT